MSLLIQKTLVSDPLMNYQAPKLRRDDREDLTWFSSMSARLAGQILFPPKSERELLSGEERLLHSFLSAKIITMRTPSGIALEGIHVAPIDLEGEGAKRAILFAPGADGYFQDRWTHEFIGWVREKVGDIHLLIVNYAGVQRSMGLMRPETAALSIYTAYSYLVDQLKIEPKRAAIFSQSLGGLISSLALPLIQERFPTEPIPLISERSMDSFLPVVSTATGGGYVGALASCFFRTIGWGYEGASETFQKAPGAKLIIYSEEDPVVLLEHSVYQALQAAGKKDERTLSLKLSVDPIDENAHFRSFKELEKEAIARHLKRMLGLSDLRTIE